MKRAVIEYPYAFSEGASRRAVVVISVSEPGKHPPQWDDVVTQLLLSPALFSWLYLRVSNRLQTTGAVLQPANYGASPFVLPPSPVSPTATQILVQSWWITRLTVKTENLLLVSFLSLNAQTFNIFGIKKEY